MLGIGHANAFALHVVSEFVCFLPDTRQRIISQGFFVDVQSLGGSFRSAKVDLTGEEQELRVTYEDPRATLFGCWMLPAAIDQNRRIGIVRNRLPTALVEDHHEVSRSNRR